MISNYEKLKLIKKLQRLAKYKFFGLHGICYYIDNELGNDSQHYMFRHFRTWEHFSGNERFPIKPDAPKYKTPDMDFIRTPGIFRWVGVRGKLRRDLCRYVAREISKELYIAREFK